MRRRLGWALALLAGGAACGGSDRGREVAAADSLARDLEIAPADTVAPVPLPDERAPQAEERQSRAGATATASRPAAPAKTRARPRAAVRRPVAKAPDTATAAVDSAVAPTASAPVERVHSDTVPTDTFHAEMARPDTIRSDTMRSDTAFTRAAPVPVPHPAPAPASTASSTDSTPAPAGTAAGAHALAVGTEIRALLEDSIHSLRNSEGQRVTARVADDLRAPDGRVLVPSGSTVRLTIARLRPARTRSARDGELELRADSLVVGNRAFAVSADVRPVPHELRGRGVTAGEVEKVAAGAVVGAAAGGVITGKTKGAVIGGAVGAAGGAVVAAQTSSRDVVVGSKTAVVLVLTAPWGGGQP